MMSAENGLHIPSGSSGSSVSWTTKMMNLLTLVLVTLPGLTVSFSNANMWRHLYEQEKSAAYPTPRTQLGRYVCCNQPPTPPSPQPRSNMRSLILSLAKRDDRDALFREARMYGSGRMGDSLPDYPSNIPGVRDEGSYRDTDLTRRDPLLTRILHVLRSPGQQRPSRYGSSAALSTSDGGARSMDFDASPFIGKRGDGAYMFTGKRGTFGDLGGPNMDWEWNQGRKKRTR
ncbi:uncharacterized protein LOC143294363 isoform X2 [Babylonia areolata]|uniref:uncharacterized protein LOC143294363 isoform X2 n=1 Tax=Babylonia areolata TaxID=304850 RepID=UPI003FD46770